MDPDRISTRRNVTPSDGFPAHAGMDPSVDVRVADVRGCWFPRPRGDGPTWSNDTCHQPFEVGFPAHAGMDPTPSPTMMPEWLLTRFPRPTRGWTSKLLDRGLQHGYSRGFPAHAGMDPLMLRSSNADQPAGFPRPRGDGPDRLKSAVDPRRRVRFPRPRGDGPPNAVVGVSLDRCRFPRPRGDGPAMSMLTSTASTVSPPTRGWTARPAGRRR